jgi:RNA polymerase sigma-70 factor (ECF subfamily)
MLTAYLLMIARNAAFSILRQKRKNKTIDIDSLPDSLFLIDNGIEEGLESKEAYQKIVNFIKSLPEIYVTVLTMHFLLNLTTQEIASSLNIKPSTAKQRLTRGKKLLRLLLQEENN